ncbi:hypothetical protein BKA70DRAFT_1360551 [Coprinopsis sp. MPI-PUGE-AT-0042]|nr:hypothetical protein BKA70DRAFT_1360551 [Coprinopsis sp. MPI-PUGE-AT-0042]
MNPQEFEDTPDRRHKEPGAAFSRRDPYQAIRVKHMSLLGDRCIFENMPHNHSVELCHVIPRSAVGDLELMENLEYRWGLPFNSLNLDTRYNALYGTPSLNLSLRIESKAIYSGSERFTTYLITADLRLLPSVEDLRAMMQAVENESGSKLPQYFNEAGRYYDYQIVPLTAKDRCVAIRAHLGPADFTIHTHPFSQLVIRSHIHPNFAVVHYGMHVASVMGSSSTAYVHPLSESEAVGLALELYSLYTTAPPEGSIDRTDFPFVHTTDSEAEKSDPNDPDYVMKALTTSTEDNRFIRTRQHYQLESPTRPSGSSNRSGGGKNSSGKTAKSGKSGRSGASVGDKRQRGS